MRIEAATKAFREAFSQAAAATPSQTPKDILKNVKASSDGKGRVKLFGTSMEFGLESWVEADATKGEILLPAARVKDWLSRVTAETLLIEGDADKLAFCCGLAEMTCGGIAPAEFPKMDEFTAKGELTVQAEALSEAIRRTQFAADEASTRYAMAGLFLDVGKDSLTVVATDSRRLSAVPLECSTIEGKPPSPILPIKAARVLRSAIAAANDGDVTIAIGDNRVSFATGSAVVVCRLVEGRFPRYRDVIPRKFNHSVALVTGPLVAAISQAVVVTNDESRGVDFAFSDGSLLLTAESQDMGQSKVSIPVPWSGDAVTVTLDARYALDALRLLPGDTLVEWKINDADSPVLLDSLGWTYIIMPLSRDR